LDIVIIGWNGNGCGSPNGGVSDVIAHLAQGVRGFRFARRFREIRLRAKKKKADGRVFWGSARRRDREVETA
jgi:hypothetical protein